jgi:hypothetical protein
VEARRLFILRTGEDRKELIGVIAVLFNLKPACSTDLRDEVVEWHTDRARNAGKTPGESAVPGAAPPAKELSASFGCERKGGSAPAFAVKSVRFDRFALSGIV